MEQELTKDWYQIKEKIYIAVDCIIFGFDKGVLKLLVFKRKVDPLKGQWSLIGSFVRENEDASVAALRVLQESTGLTKIFLEELKTYSNVDRDPGARCISIAQYALIRIEDSNKVEVEKHGARWFEVDKLPELIFDHNIMVADALARLRSKVQYQPIGFELLPTKFTIPQLQLLYEQLFQKKIDTRNFRKKILMLNILEELGEKDRTTSKKGAFLYKFDQERYQNLIKNGFNRALFKK